MASDSREVAATTDPTDLLALHEALDRLAVFAPRQSRVVELRLFGGLQVPEAAEVLGVSTGTVKGDWSMARAWLYRQLAQQ
jgi:DNA-directed RNA polymerase specialized sigma24 family protein